MSLARGPLGTFCAAESDGALVTITDDVGTTAPIPAAWLRDNCCCRECRIEATGEHRYLIADSAELPRPGSLLVDGGTLVIDWTDGHRSRFVADDLSRLDRIAARANPPAEHWPDDFVPSRFVHADIVSDLDTRLEFLAAAQRHGMAIVTHMPDHSGACIDFLDALALPVRDTPFDRLHDVFFRADGYNVAHTDEALPPHNDFASYAWPPSGQLIHMLVNEVAGGEWVNVDGFKIVTRLMETDPDAVRTLARVPIGFREHSDQAESWTRAPLVRLDSCGAVTGLRFSNQLMQPMSPYDPDVSDFYEAYHLLARAIVDPANQIEFRAHAGTMQFLHGHRVLHARRRFDGTSGARHLQDTYFDFDDVASLVARMSGEAR